MAVILYRRRAPVVSMMSGFPNGWFAWGRSAFGGFGRGAI